MLAVFTYLRLNSFRNVGPWLFALFNPGVMSCANFSIAAVDGFGCVARRQLHCPRMRIVRQSVVVQMFSFARSLGLRFDAFKRMRVAI